MSQQCHNKAIYFIITIVMKINNNIRAICCPSHACESLDLSFQCLGSLLTICLIEWTPSTSPGVPPEWLPPAGSLSCLN